MRILNEPAQAKAEVEAPKNAPQTVRNLSSKSIEIGKLETDMKDVNKLDYLLNRDPMQEFFQLTC